jgi:hypothetical protein
MTTGLLEGDYHEKRHGSGSDEERGDIDTEDVEDVVGVSAPDKFYKDRFLYAYDRTLYLHHTLK